MTQMKLPPENPGRFTPSIGRIKRSFERRVRASTDFRMPAMASVCFSLLLVRTAPAIRGKNGVECGLTYLRGIQLHSHR